MGLNDHPSFVALKNHHKTLGNFNLRQSLQDQRRYESLTVTLEGITFDFSKHLVTPQTIPLLLALAQERDVAGWREKMFTGGRINTSEKRAVLHTALRAPADADIRVDGVNVIPAIHETRARMAAFADKIRSDKTITDVVSIGIGGSDLGPRFVTDALIDAHTGPVIHFVSNVDGRAILGTLKNLNPKNTLVIIASKTFTTEETMLNAAVAREWLEAGVGKGNIGTHLAALSTATEKAIAFGVTPDRIFDFADWVGGRYSLWSAIGLPVMLAVGPKIFDQLLAGAFAMDTHFRLAPLEKNIPVLMGLLGIWYRNFWNYPVHMLLPYDQRLRRLVKFIQQMDMESNGKSVNRDGQAMDVATGPVIFGEPGTDSQHSFMQLVHQGEIIPVDFIAAIKADHHLTDNHQSLLANCFAQSRALAIGQTLDEAGGDAGRVFSGNRPSTTILLPQLDAYHLGMLLAAYEHKVFVQGVIWGVNSFDQPGVELGKKLAKAILPALADGEHGEGFDLSTTHLIDIVRHA